MLQSRLFTKTRKEAPREIHARNAELLIRAGFIHQELSGVYSYLPLGLRVLEKINAIIRREMAALGATELLMSALQNEESWQLSGRHDLPVWFKTTLNAGGTLGLGWSHEEAVTVLMKNHFQSYKDLPCAVYQIQTKFRNEERAKSGLLRGREFLMKDMYSFHLEQSDLDKFYERVKEAYRKIFQAVGLGDRTFLTVASGGAFSQWSHEFQTLAPAGEDTIYLDEARGLAVNQEVYNEQTLAELGLDDAKLVKCESIEVGNIFKLGTRFSAPLELTCRDEAGQLAPVIMGSYGLGASRLLGTVAEVLSTDKGLNWPMAVAPFSVHLLLLAKESAEVVLARAKECYQAFTQAGIEVLFDDRAASPGEKLADADLLGLPYRLVVSERSLAAGGYEVYSRASGEIKTLDLAAALKLIHG